MNPFEKAARAHANSRASKGTRYLYNMDLDNWLDHCAQLGVDPSSPTLEAATEWRSKLEEKHAPQTVRRTLSALSSMYAFAIEFEPSDPKASCNPFRPRALPRPSAFLYSQTEALSDIEARRVIVEAEKENSDFGVRDVALLRLMYEIGMRVSSAVSLKTSSLFTRDGALFARIFVKGGKIREVALPATVTAALEKWAARRGPASVYVFPDRTGKSHMVTNAVNKRLTLYGKRAGVEHVHPHRFRASYITSALDAGLALHEVQASVHHEDPKTTLRYDRGKRGTGVSDAVAKFRKGREE